MLNTLKVEKIPSSNCFNTFAKVNIKFNDCITILNNKNVLYHYKNASSYNNYEKNKPKEKFLGLNKQYYIEQNLDYDSDYLLISDGNIQKLSIIKDNKKTLLSREEIPSIVSTKYVSRYELEEILSSKECDNLLVISSDGKLIQKFANDSSAMIELNIPSEDQIVTNFKENNIKIIDFELNQLNEKKSKNAKIKRDYLNKMKERYINVDMNNLNFGINILDTDIILVKYKDNNIVSINDIYIKLVSPNRYKIQSMQLQLENIKKEDIQNKKLLKNKVLK